MLLKEVILKKNYVTKLFEGGNLSIRGREAQHLDLKVTKRSYMVPKLNELLHAINNAYFKMTKQALWDPKVLQSGQFLSGSSLHFFNVTGIDDDTFFAKKPTVGDIDTMVDKTKEVTLQQFLTAYDDKKLGPSIFRGFQRGNEQFSALFELQDPPVSVQIDFEFVEYQNGVPTDWARFSHSSSWEDLQQGVKGVFHKGLIQSLSALSRQDFLQRKLVGRGKMRAEQDVPMTDNMYSFAVSSKEGGGLRAKYEPVLGPKGKPLVVKGLPVMSATPAEGYIQDIGKIFSTLLGKRLPKTVTQQISNNFWSFTGLVNLLAKILTPEEKEAVFDSFVLKTVGPGAQGMYKNNPDKDIKEKLVALNYIMKALGVSKPKEFDQLMQQYQQSYKVTAESTLTEAPNYKRQGIQHIYNPGTTVEIKDIDFIELCKEIAENDGTLDNAPINLKVDGAGIRFGKDQNGKPFFMTSKVTEPKYIENYGDFTKYAQSMGSSEDRVQFASNYDKALKLIVTSDFMKAIPPDTIVQAEMLFNDMAQQSKEGYKFVNINYDPKKLGKAMTLVPFMYKQYSTGETRPDAAKIQQGLLKASDNNIKIISNNLQQSGINVSKIINPIVANADSLTNILKVRGDSPQKEKAKQIISNAKKALSDAIINSPIKGKDILGKNIEGLVINMPSGRLLKVTSQTMKDAMLAKQQQVKVAPAGPRSGKTAVVTAGSFVGHKGHEQLVNFVLNKAKQLGADPYVYISPSVGPDDPIPPQMKLATWQKLYPELANIFQVWQEGGTPVKKIEKELVTRTNPPPYDKIIVMVGDDRYEGFKNWIEHLSKRMKDPRYPGFEHVEFSVEITPRDPSQGGTGISFTQCREVLKDTSLSEQQQLSYWTKAFDVKKLGVDWIKKLMDTARQNMGITNMNKKNIKEFIQKTRPLLKEASIEQKIKVLKLLKEYKQKTIPSKVATCQYCKHPETKCSCSQREGVEEHIVKVKGGYELKSKHGNKNLGKYPTKAGAEKRERQVQYFKHQGVAEDRENYNGVNLLLQKDDDELFVKASAGGRELGHVLFVIDGEYLMPQDLEVEERYRGQGIAQTMYDYVKSKGYKIRRSGQQTDAGAGFWDKHKGQGQNVWELGVAEGFGGNWYIRVNGKILNDTKYKPEIFSSEGEARSHAMKLADKERIPLSQIKLTKSWMDAPEQGVAEEWSQKYKSSINCSHPKGFSQKAHCAGKKKHNESVEMEMVCEDCGMCQTHGDHSKDNIVEACWKGYHKEGNKKMFGKTYPNCVKNKNESLETYINKGECPGCGGVMVAEGQLNEKQDACYHKVKSRYKVWPSAYASGALVQCRKKGASNWGNGGKKNESMTLEELEESLHDWFTKEKWVRMDTKGNIKGPCAREPGEGKPKCLPQSKAHNLGKKGRASAAQRKRREDPNPERHGPAINVNTKKKSNESIAENSLDLTNSHPMDWGKKTYMIRQISKATGWDVSDLSLASDEEIQQLYDEHVESNMDQNSDYLDEN